MTDTQLRSDCRHFPADRPCRFHKEDGRLCAGSQAAGSQPAACGDYSPASERILIVKLAAMGDVLRTTAVLPALRKAHLQAHISWIVDPASVGLLENIPELDRVLACSPPVASVLQVEEFDLVLSLDMSTEGAALGTAARAPERVGFVLSSRGEVLPVNENSRGWYEMSHLDGLKCANTLTVQEMTHRAAGLDPSGQHIIVNLTGAEREFAAAFSRRAGLEPGRPVVGMAPGAGPRWQAKRWTTDGYCDVACRAVRELGASVLLFGGPGDGDVADGVLARCGKDIIDTGRHNTVRELMALVDLCDVVVTGDTLPIHVAAGLGKKVVGLFGPTSASEIDLYGRGVKLAGDVECLCCYRASCSRSPTCMETLQPERVFDAVRRHLA